MKRSVYFLAMVLLLAALTGCEDYNSTSIDPVGSSSVTEQTLPAEDPVKTEPSQNAAESTGHIHNYLGQRVAATCTDEGYIIHICDCGHTFSDEYTDPLGHTWTEWCVTTNPTTEETGLRERSCICCGATDAQVLEKLAGDHVHGYTETVVEASCLADGYSLFTCSCGSSYRDKVTSALGHDFGEYQSNADGSCTMDGTKTAVCSRCGETSTVSDPGSVLGHNWGEWEVTVAPTEEEEGWKIRTCATCGATDSMQIDKLPESHVHSYREETVAPTCTEAGYTRYTCDCGHNYQEPGQDATGHSWGEWVVTKEPTTISEGTKERTCASCGETEQSTVAKLPVAGSFVIVEWTEEVVRNTEASVTILGTPGVEYTITVYYKSGPSTAAGLEPAVADADGYVTWVWKVGAKTSAGSYEIEISGGGETQTVYFTVLVE